MALFSRSGGEAEAVYARVLDGAHLWLAVRGEGPLSLRGDGVEIDVPTEDRDGLLTAVVALDGAATSGWAALTLMAGSGRKAAPVQHAAPGGDASITRDPGAFRVEDSDGAVVVRRTQVRGIDVTRLESREDGVEVSLRSTPQQVSLVVKDAAVAELPVTDGRLVIGTVVDLPAGTTATFRIGDGPLVRTRNVLARPNHAVLLPPMLEPDVELRWLKDGRLAVHRGTRD